MSKIKIGQIYKSKYNSNIKVVITQETLAGFNIIYTDGSMQKSVNADEFDDIWVFENEYPTWQEAVNSKEFNGSVKDTVKDTVNNKEFKNE